MENEHNGSAVERERLIIIGLNVAFARKKAGLKQADLAEMAGVSPKHISNIETPNVTQAVSLKTLFKLADALGVTVQSLFVGL